MERGYVVVIMTAPASSEELVAQCLAANSEAAGKELQAGLKAWRERHGFTRLEVGICGKGRNPESATEEGVSQDEER